MILRKCKEECSICAHHYIILNTCKYNNCSYKICNRCLFLYAREKCPACTRENAFSLTKYKCDKYNCSKECHAKVKHWCKVLFCFLYYSVLIIIVFHLLCLIGVVVGLFLNPNSCCSSYKDFVSFGLFHCVVLACGIFFCICICCKHSDDE